MVGDVAPGELLGKYRIEAPIGQGGFSTVFRATQTGPGGFNRSVALKLLRGQDGGPSEDLAFFFREARVIATLSHRNVVQVFELARERGLYFLVMELVEGATLTRLLRRGPLAPHLATGIAMEVSRALAYAHARGVIHRDIKPSNILVSAQGDVKVADFGLAKIVGTAQLSALGAVMGTPSYMSPEQRAGLPATPRSDVYSLAVLLLRMCADELPTPSGEGVLSSDRAVLAPPPLRALIARGLAAEPWERLHSSELAEALQQALAELASGERIARLADELAQVVRGVQQETAAPPAREGNTVPAAAERAFAPAVLARPAPAGELPVQESTVPGPAPGGEPTVPRAAGDGSTTGRAPAAAPPRRTWARGATTRAGALLAAGALVVVVLALLGVWLLRRPGDLRGAAPRVVDLRVVPDLRAAPPAPEARLQRSRDGGSLEAGTDAVRTSAPPAPRRTSRPWRAPRSGSHKAPPAADGALTVNSDPWSVVFLDGRKLGMTPLYRVRVPAGSHRLKLVPAEGNPLVRQVEVAPGEHSNLGMILLH